MIEDAVTTNTTDLLESGLSTIEVDDLVSDSAFNITKSRRQGQFPLMMLPAEVRLQIFTFLLPNLKTMYPSFGGTCFSGPGSCEKHHGGPRNCHGDMAVMCSNRQIYEETSNYLYNRSTLVIIIGDDGVRLLSSHWESGEISGSSLTEFAFDKFKLVWLHIQVALPLRMNLVHVRRNFLDFCAVLCQTRSPKSLRVDLFDPGHWEAGITLDSHKPTSVQGGVKMVTKDIEYVMRQHNCTRETAEMITWRQVNSTGTLLAATDVEIILQPLKLLRGVERCQIFLNPHLQSETSLVELVARHEEIAQSKKDLTMADLKSVHDVSEDLYRLAALTHDAKFTHLHPIEQKRMEHLLWQTRKLHKLPCAPVEECRSRLDDS